MADDARQPEERQEEARIEEPEGNELRIEDDPIDMERELREFRRALEEDLEERRRNRFEDDFDDEAVMELRRRRRAGGLPDDAARHGEGAAAAAAGVAEPRPLDPIVLIGNDYRRLLGVPPPREIHGGRERGEFALERVRGRLHQFPRHLAFPPRPIVRRRFDEEPLLEAEAALRMAEEDAFDMIVDNFLLQPGGEAQGRNNQVIPMLEGARQPVGVPNEARIEQRDGGIAAPQQDANAALRDELNRLRQQLRARMEIGQNGGAAAGAGAAGANGARDHAVEAALDELVGHIHDRPELAAQDGMNQVIQFIRRMVDGPRQPAAVPNEARVEQRPRDFPLYIPLHRIREEQQGHNDVVRAERNRRMMELRERMIARRNENGPGGADNRQEAIADYMREMWDIRQGPMDAEIRARRAMDEERRRVHEAWARRAPQELLRDNAVVAEAADRARQHDGRRWMNDNLRRMEAEWAEDRRRMREQMAEIRRRRIEDEEAELDVEMELAPRPAGERGEGQAAAMAEDVLRRQAELREMRAAREEMLRRDEARVNGDLDLMGAAARLRHGEGQGLVDRMLGGAARLLPAGAVRYGLVDEVRQEVRWRGLGGGLAVGGGRGGRQQRVTDEMIATAARLKEEDDRNDPSPARFSRACSICVIANPRQRAVYSKCGHIVCYPCAVETAKREEFSAKCPTCRATTGFVKLYETELNDATNE